MPQNYKRGIEVTFGSPCYFRDGELANENKLKDGVDYAAYKSATPDALPKFKFRKVMIDDFKEVLMPEILPLAVK